MGDPMKYVVALWLLLAGIVPPVFAGQAPKSTGSVDTYTDYVKIRYMPSRSGFIKEKNR